MVKNIILLFTLLSASIFVNAQTDTLKCKEYFEHYDTLLGENLIVIWETPPILKKYSQKDISNIKEFAREQINFDYTLLDMIIDTRGVPVCFRFKQEIKLETKEKLIDKLKMLRFSPALNKDKEVESIYTLKL